MAVHGGRRPQGQRFEDAEATDYRQRVPSLAQFETLRDYIEQRISQAHAPAMPTPPVGEPDVAEQIRKLAALRDEGLLSSEEFETKKAEMLSRM
jgi:Short C-terminal domain